MEVTLDFLQSTRHESWGGFWYVSSLSEVWERCFCGTFRYLSPYVHLHSQGFMRDSQAAKTGGSM